MKKNIIISIGIVLAILIPIVMAYHAFPPIPVKFTNIDDGNTADGNLFVWAATNGSCVDDDTGIFKPNQDGNTSFTDADDGNFYDVDNQCADGKTIIAFSCTDDVLIDGKKIRNDLFVAAYVDCSQFKRSNGSGMICFGGRCV